LLSHPRRPYQLGICSTSPEARSCGGVWFHYTRSMMHSLSPYLVAASRSRSTRYTNQLLAECVPCKARSLTFAGHQYLRAARIRGVFDWTNPGPRLNCLRRQDESLICILYQVYFYSSNPSASFGLISLMFFQSHQKPSICLFPKLGL
jgi:hypothetical protein